MSLLDTIKDTVAKFVPQKETISKPGMGSMLHEDNVCIYLFIYAFNWRELVQMIVSKPTIVFHASEIFFSFLALCCFSSVAAFQAKWGVGPCECTQVLLTLVRSWQGSTSAAGLSGFAIFISLLGMFTALFMLLVPVIYEKYDKLIRLARALKEVRVGFILAGAGLTLTFLIR